jgi:hypothetical protein
MTLLCFQTMVLQLNHCASNLLTSRSIYPRQLNLSKLVHTIFVSYQFIKSRHRQQNWTSAADVYIFYRVDLQLKAARQTSRLTQRAIYFSKQLVN